MVTIDITLSGTGVEPLLACRQESAFCSRQTGYVKTLRQASTKTHKMQR